MILYIPPELNKTDNTQSNNLRIRIFFFNSRSIEAMLSRTLTTLMRAPSRKGGLVSYGNVGPQSLSDSRQKHTLPDLPYDYNALEPVVSAEIMQLHHR